MEDKDPKTEIGFSSKTLKFAVNQVVWRISVPKLNLDFVPKSCKYAVNQVVWRISKGPKPESGFSPKIMQIRCKPGGLEDKDPKTESGFTL